jgi:hypothetical protein
MLPEMPDKLKDSPEFEIEYVGKLSLATKNFEVSGAFQTLQMFTELAQYVPQMAQPLGNVDGDKLFRQSWFANSASMNALKSPETVQEEREAAAEAQKQQQLINNLPNIGDAVLKGGKAPEEGSPAAMIMGQ